MHRLTIGCRLDYKDAGLFYFGQPIFWQVFFKYTVKALDARHTNKLLRGKAYQV